MSEPMSFVSTRGQSPAVGLSAAIAAGLAPDGGLYVPQALPPRRALQPRATLAETAIELLAPFFAGDALEAALPAICRAAFDFDAPLAAPGSGDDHVLELFHGPTAAFKDFGARFLAQCLSRLQAGRPPLTIVVATSGDTGAAVAAAFHQVPGLRVAVLYPDGRVSPRQAHQLGCFGDNITAYRVDGSFDDCQAMAKAVLGDGALQAQVPLSSANSISLGRLLPQMAYYAHAALVHRRDTGQALNLAIPTGNLGNAMAAILARSLGVPLGQIVLATNANTVLPDFFAGRAYAPGPSVATLANAMDVGAPSNFERLRWFWQGDEAALRRDFTAASVSDARIAEVIALRHAAFGQIHCPHTACALAVLEDMRGDGRAAAGSHWAVVATAHPAKFDRVVEPLIGAPVPVPPPLAELLSRPAQARPLAAKAKALAQELVAAGMV